MTHIRLAYKETEAIRTKVNFSLKKTDTHSVGYRSVFRIGDHVQEQELFFSSKGQQGAATLAVMKLHPGAVVRETKYLKN